MTNTLYIKH